MDDASLESNMDKHLQVSLHPKIVSKIICSDNMGDSDAEMSGQDGNSDEDSGHDEDSMSEENVDLND
ncbi:putative A-kinase anchor protein 7-like isoform X3 [Sesbania bispinosa]|nr:putative A-kinase anchor protein 7-like isoform X3 [Sesbania bispinosa]